jgi:hypothetical protein
MTAEATLFEDPPQLTWRRPKSRGQCTRDVQAGPGTCWYWWDWCPNADKRGCFVRFAQNFDGERYSIIDADAVRVER